MRFEGNLNVDINDIVTNLVPFPKLNFLSSSMTPFFQQVDIKVSPKLIDQMFTDAFQSDSQLMSIEPKQSVFLASSLIARGAIHISDLRRNIDRIKSQIRFVPWNLDGWKTGLCDIPPLGQKYSVLSLTNNTAFWRILDRLDGRFLKLYKRKAHLHHYLDYMDQQEFIDAQNRVREIMTEYSAIEDKTL
jgi:tubulin epsilon